MNAPPAAVVIDTDVFSIVYVRDSHEQARELRKQLTGLFPVIATQTRAELMVWPRRGRWGHTQTSRLHELLSKTATVPVTGDVVDAYVELSVECRARGHALHAKVHTADRWVAATAIAVGRPLLSLDRVYDGTPGLSLL